VISFIGKLSSRPSFAIRDRLRSHHTQASLHYLVNILVGYSNADKYLTVSCVCVNSGGTISLALLTSLGVKNIPLLNVKIIMLIYEHVRKCTSEMYSRSE